MPLPDPYPVIDNVTIFTKIVVGRNSNVPGSIVQHMLVNDNLSYELIVSPLNKAQIDNVTVSQTIAFQIVKSFQDNLKVSQVIGFSVDRQIPPLLSFLPITQYVVAYIDRGVSGNSGAVFVDPTILAIQAALTPVTEVTFSGFGDSSGSITLRKPDFGDTDNYSPYRVQRNTLGGGLEIFRDAMWEETSTYEMTFSWLSQSEAVNFASFIKDNLGKRIHFTDHFGQLHDGYLSSPDARIIQPKVVGFSITVTFQEWTM